MILILAIILPIVTGVLLPVMRLKARARNLYMMVCTLLTSVLVAIALTGDFTQLELISLNKKLSISLHLDDLGKVFSAVIALLWPLTLLYALSYMKDAVNQTSFFTFFQMSYGVTLGIAMSANLLTLYIFYELMTLSTLPLVLHSGSAKSVKAGLKYLYYSLHGRPSPLSAWSTWCILGRHGFARRIVYRRGIAAHCAAATGLPVVFLGFESGGHLPGARLAAHRRSGVCCRSPPCCMP